MASLKEEFANFHNSLHKLKFEKTKAKNFDVTGEAHELGSSHAIWPICLGW